MAAQAEDISKASGGSSGYSFQHGPWWQNRLWPGTWLQAIAQNTDIQWPSVVSWAMDINTAPATIASQTQTWPSEAAQIMNMNMASGGTPEHACPLVVTWARDINMSSSFGRTMDNYMNLSLQHGLGQWFIDTKVASRGSTDHSVFLRRFNPGNELFFILDILFKRDREIVWLGSCVQGAEFSQTPCWH